MIIRPLEPADWPAVEQIYREGIEAGSATFETQPPSWESFDTGKVRDARLVAVDDAGTAVKAGSVIGWAAASPVSSRPAYRGVIEHSVYVATAAQGTGVGRALLRAFLETAEAAGYWTVQSGIFPENTASIRLHESEGFRAVGTRESIALMTNGPYAGQWRDTVLVEWRSGVNGR